MCPWILDFIEGQARSISHLNSASLLESYLRGIPVVGAGDGRGGGRWQGEGEERRSVRKERGTMVPPWIGGYGSVCSSFGLPNIVLLPIQSRRTTIKSTAPPILDSVA